MKKLAIAAVALLAMSACSKSNTTETTVPAEAETPCTQACCPFAGEWAVTAVAIAGTDTVNTDPATTRIVFGTDSTFHVSTNCNSIEGNWVASCPDSITVNPLLRTEMACDDMSAEEAIIAALPLLTNFTATDTTLTLTAADPASFVTLVKVCGDK
ncbi:MAG: META domain-containing protein [Muribaculaceae bacterium]|nr:META domain-containing protein [Muribaculaceae bacterium]